MVNAQFALVINSLFFGFLKGPDINITEDYLEFRAHGIGGSGRNLYSFKLDFYLPIDSKVNCCHIFINILMICTLYNVVMFLRL
jgi:hypothetical protein